MRFFTVLLLFLVAACASSVDPVLVDVDEAESLITDEDVFVLNTHTPYGGEIPGTDHIIEDWKNIELYSDELPADKNARILVYCRSGSMSSSAADQLAELGYTNVFDLDGGMNAWKASGRDVVFER